MRVLFVTLAVFGGSKKGGGERFVTELARALRRLGCDVTIAVVAGMRSFAEQENIDLPPVPVTYKRFIALVRSADLVHVHQLNTPGFDYAATACCLFRKPLVLTDHGGGAVTPGRMLGSARLRLIDAAGFVSTWSQRDIDPVGVIRCQRVILGGGDHLPEAFPLKERFDFGFVGRLLPHKGPHVAIEALPSGASLIMAGQARDPAYFAELVRLAEGKSVSFIQNAEDNFVASLHRSVQYLLVPSVQSYRESSYARPELLGLAALEALSAGTPVIGSDVGGLGEVLRVAGQHVLPPGDVVAWRAHLSNVLLGPTLRVSAVDFRWDVVAGRCIDIYESVLSYLKPTGGCG